MTNLHLYTLLAIIAALCVALWWLSTTKPCDERPDRDDNPGDCRG